MANEHNAPRAKAKIIATLGPASERSETIRALIEAGVDCFRFNFSHGSREGHAKAAARVRASDPTGRVAILADLQGPRIRIGSLPAPIRVKAGDALTITTGSPTPGQVPTSYERLADDVAAGDRLLVDGGLMELRVVAVDGGLVRCRAVTAGEIGANKGLNLPGVVVSAPTLSDKDIEDAAAALSFGADYLALSFVRGPEDILRLRAALGDSDVPIVAKIERAEAVAEFEPILEVADGVMVARGDLGAEVPLETLPGIQKKIIALANTRCKPVIIATEMLQSMTTSPRPTRAEASDVANAILDGTDAVMLSGETAIGHYPLRVVDVMGRISREAEKSRRLFKPPTRHASELVSFAAAVADAACAAAAELAAKAIVVFTISGQTAWLVAQRRPEASVVALTPHAQTMRRLALAWGVTPILQPLVEDSAEMVKRADYTLKEAGLIRAGEVIVIVGGQGPLSGTTNFTKMHTVR